MAGEVRIYAARQSFRCPDDHGSHSRTWKQRASEASGLSIGSDKEKEKEELQRELSGPMREARTCQ